jgi:CRISPR-associated protein Cst2
VLPSGKGDKKVIQFDLKTENIISSPELDFFGYMGTESMNMRKSPIGMTKAISLLPWEGDLLFYANHGLVKRAKNDDPSIQPNPYSKEEHDSLFGGNITINNNVLGNDYWLLEEANLETEENGFVITSKKVKYTFAGFHLKSENEFENDKGTIKIEKVAKNDKALKVIFTLNKKEKEKRLKDFLKVVKNGICFHSSGEAPGLNPVFLIAAIVDVPMPVFHGYVELNEDYSKLKASNLNNALKNQYIQNYFVFDGIDILDASITEKTDKKIDKWDDFVNKFLEEAE